MSTIDLHNAEGEKGGTVELPDDLFGQTTNIPLIHQVVTAQLAAARQGTHSTKTRGQVSGGGAKPWRQKGTGRARQGSRRAPQWVGGGIVHGPQPRSYRQKTPKRMVEAALLGVLSDRARDNRLLVVDRLVTGDAPSAKQAAATLTALGEYRTVLVVLDRDDYIGWLSARNLPEAHVIAVDQLNAYDVVVADAVVFSRAAIEVFAAAKGSAVVVKEIKVEKPKADKKPAAKKSGEEDDTEAETTGEETEAEAKSAKKAAAKKSDETDADKAEAKPAKKAKAAAETSDEAGADAKPAKKAAAKKADEADEAEAKPAKKPAAKKPAAGDKEETK